MRMALPGVTSVLALAANVADVVKFEPGVSAHSRWDAATTTTWT